MNGSHIIAVNLMLGSRSAWPPSNGRQVADGYAGAQLDMPQDVSQDLPPSPAAPRPAKSAWSLVWQRISCLLD